MEEASASSSGAHPSSSEGVIVVIESGEEDVVEVGSGDEDVVVVEIVGNSCDSAPKRKQGRRSADVEDADYEPGARSVPSGPRRRAPKRGQSRRATAHDAVAGTSTSSQAAQTAVNSSSLKATKGWAAKVEDSIVSSSASPPAKKRSPVPAPAKKRPTPARKRPSAVQERPSCEAVAELPTGWSDLPHPALVKTYKFLQNKDVISAGQACRSWREAAKLHSVWRKRKLSYDTAGANSKKFHNWHAGARQFARTIRFAPCLGRVSCPKSLKPAAKKAINTQSKCVVKSAELNGQLQWCEKYISRQRNSLEDLSLLNPKTGILKTALALPLLASLTVAFERDPAKEKYQLMYGTGWSYEVPILSRGTKGTLKRLICHSGVRAAAVEALVYANADTLEEVGAHSFPVDALQHCAALHRLLIPINPDDAVHQARLRQLLQGRAPLEYLAFIGTRRHARDRCTALRASLHDRVRDRAIVCSSCDKVSALDKPRFATRNVPSDDEGDSYDFMEDLFWISHGFWG